MQHCHAPADATTVIVISIDHRSTAPVSMLHSSCAEAPEEVLATFEACLQQFTSYAISEDVQQASAISAPEKVLSESGSQFTTTPDLARNVRQAGSAVATGVHTVGEYVGKGIVQVGEWYRSRYAPCEEPTKVSDLTKSRYVRPAPANRGREAAHIAQRCWPAHRITGIHACTL